MHKLETYQLAFSKGLFSLYEDDFLKMVRILPYLRCCLSIWYWNWIPATAFVDKSCGFDGRGGRARRLREDFRPEVGVSG